MVRITYTGGSEPPPRGLRSIFSFRPLARTTAPPPPARRRGGGAMALVALALASPVLGGDGVRSAERSEVRVAEVHVGRAALKRSTDGKELRWWKRSATVAIDGSVADLGRATVDAVQAAFGAWLDASPNLPRLTFDVRSNSTTPAMDGENRIYFAPIEAPGHENDVAITLAYSDARSGEIFEADIILNSRRTYSVLSMPPEREPEDDRGGRDGDRGGYDDDRRDRRDGDRERDGDHGDGDRGRRDHDDGDRGARGGSPESDGAPSDSTIEGCSRVYDVESVVAHEAGHFFGLGEDTEEAHTTMSARTGACEVRKRNLAEGDVAAITTLYAAPLAGSASGDEDGAARGCSVDPGRSGGARSRGGGSWSALVLLFAIRIARRTTRVSPPRPGPARPVPVTLGRRSRRDARADLA